MIITLNQKEIESILVDGLVGMGILHGKEAEVTMVAGRSPAGMTAEVKFEAPERPVVVEGTFGPGPSGFAPAGTVETYGSSNPDGLPPKADTDTEEKEEETLSDEDLKDKPLFPGGHAP